VKVLITGVAGFVASHLVDYLESEHRAIEVFGLARPHGTAPPALPGRLALVEADLEDAASVEAAIEMVRPDRIVHLAAQSSVHRSWSDPAGTLRSNVLGLLHLLEAVRKRALSPRILVVGSAEEYGLVPASELPLREDAPLRPNSPYAVSKVAQGFLALQYALSHHMGIVRTRTFHHTGPGRGESFAESSFARQLAEIAAGRREPVIQVGNLEAVRDFSDVRDVVRAYWALLDRGDAGEVYNVCSGAGVRIRDVLQKLIEASGLDVEVRVDPERRRPSDIPVLVGDPGRLRAATSWQPRLRLEESLRDLLQYWRERVGAPTPSRSSPRVPR
jgi:GDP-4-dehydro-6-deoxy-D-mannose reductase